ncbi:MAG: hypothetical protein MUE61_08750 [Vicinamibacterales bacterium]|jgi:hypothetical protein|nr:hypothetical protein [Vicinamibacterales bacterium]
MKTVLSLVAAAWLAAVGIAAQAPASDVWRSFEGTLSATGQRQSIATESGRPATTVQLSGPVAIAAGAGLSRAFRSEVVGFDDGAGLTVLRGVWTDDRGDRIFTRLKGETVASGRRIAGTITGGTGRYAGITGEYSFEWQYVVEAEAGTISGRAVGLRGRYRIAGAGK